MTIGEAAEKFSGGVRQRFRQDGQVYKTAFPTFGQAGCPISRVLCEKWVWNPTNSGGIDGKRISRYSIQSTAFHLKVVPD